MKSVKTGIIGIGNMGSAHLKSIIDGKVPGMVVTAVCDINKDRRSFVQHSYPQAEIYEQYTDLLKSSDTDAVIIAVPHPFHAEIAEAAFNHGKHVLVEKPVDIKVSAALKMNDAAHRSGKKFAVMFNQRTNDLFQKARSLVQNGDMGSIKRSVWIITNWYRTQSYYDSGDWRATWSGEGGGVLLNQAPHNLDLWQWICGMPKKITAFCNTGKFHDIEVEDEATIYAEYENNATGVFIASTGDCPGTNRLEITGTRGKLVLEGGLLKHWRLKHDERDICANSENGFVTPDTEYTEYASENEGGHAEILKNFADAILYGKELLAPGYDGLNELILSNAAYLSEWTGNKKITLPFDNAEFDKLLAQKTADSKSKRAVAKRLTDTSTASRWKVNW